VTNQGNDDLSDFDRRLKAARGTVRSPFDSGERGAKPKYGMLGLAFRMGIELVSALAVGTAMGWGLDKWLGTGPWMLIIGIVLGGAAGVLNVYRFASGFGGAVGYKQAEHDRAEPDA
jgi:ATP synthase protein I